MESIIESAGTLPAINWIKQPCNVTFLHGDIDRVQLSIIVAVMERIQEHLEYIHSNRISGNEIKGVFDKDGDVEYSLPIANIGVGPKYYSRVDEAVKKLSTMVFEGYEYNDEGDLVHGYYPLFSSLKIPEFSVKNPSEGQKKTRRSSYIQMSFNKKAVGYYLDMKQYTKYIKDVVMRCKCMYAFRMYQFISTYAYKGCWRVKYKELRKMFGMDDAGGNPVKYSTYRDFKRRVITDSMNELTELADQDNTNYYFTFEEVYKNGIQKGDPDSFVFYIIKTNYGKHIDIQNMQNRIDSPIGSKMREIGFNDSEIFAFVNNVNQDRVDEVYKDLIRLAKYVNESSNSVNYKVAYVRKSIQKYIQESIPVADEIKGPESMVAADVMANQPVITPDDQRKLNALGSAMHTFMKADDFLVWYCQAEVSVQNDRVVAKFTDKEMAAAFKEKYGELFTDNVKQIFWLGVKAVIE